MVDPFLSAITLFWAKLVLTNKANAIKSKNLNYENTDLGPKSLVRNERVRNDPNSNFIKSSRENTLS